MESSINIFQNSVPDGAESNISPPELFEAAQRVTKTKRDEILRHRTGIYLIQYSENGPFQSHIPGWLPIHVTRVLKWTSGGIREEEFQQYLN